MPFNPQQISKGVASCDERIASIQTKLNSWKVYGRVLGLVSLEMEDKNAEKMKNYENNIQLIKVEKLIYQSLAKSGNGAIFPKLFQKYSDLMAISYDISGNMVRLDGVEDQEYLEYCASSLKQREFINMVCFYGETR